MEESLKETYLKTKDRAFSVRGEIFDIYDYAFRGNKHLMERAAKIKVGRSDMDLMLDGLTNHNLRLETEAELLAAKADMKLFDESLSLHQQMAQLMSKISTSIKQLEESKVTVMQAWTWLHAALSEIYAAGKYVYRNAPQVKELFFMDFYQNIGKQSSKNSKINQDTTVPTAS